MSYQLFAARQRPLRIPISTFRIPTSDFPIPHSVLFFIPCFRNRLPCFHFLDLLIVKSNDLAPV